MDAKVPMAFVICPARTHVGRLRVFWQYGQEKSTEMNMVFVNENLHQSNPFYMRGRCVRMMMSQIGDEVALHRGMESID